jgi:ubiquitin C-terminal hydrolase
MLMGGLRVTVRILAMVLSRRSVNFRLVMLTNIVMMCRFKVVMGCCMMMCGSSVMMLAGRVFLFRHAELS